MRVFAPTRKKWLPNQRKKTKPAPEVEKADAGFLSYFNLEDLGVWEQWTSPGKFDAIHQASVQMFLKSETFDLAAAPKEKSGYRQSH